MEKSEMSYRVVFSNGTIIDDIELSRNNPFPAGPKAWKAALNQIIYDKSKEILNGEVFEIKKDDNNGIRFMRSIGKYKTKRSTKK